MSDRCSHRPVFRHVSSIYYVLELAREQYANMLIFGKHFALYWCRLRILCVGVGLLWIIQKLLKHLKITCFNTSTCFKITLR